MHVHCPTESIPGCPILPDEIIHGSDVADGHQIGPTSGPIIPPIRFRQLRAGCYYLSFMPTIPIGRLVTRFYGTMRVEKPSVSSTTASGDLYAYPLFSLPGSPTAVPPTPSGIPMFSRSRYRYYLRVTQILEGFTIGNHFTLGFEKFRFTAATPTASPAWTSEGTFTAQMKWVPTPPGYASDFLTGQVLDSANHVVGTLGMGWVSPYLRRVTVEIDTVPGSEAPLNNADGIQWQTIGDQIGWQFNTFVSNTNVAAPSGDSWSDAEMHAAMLARRDSADLDNEWRYHILAVHLINSTPRGIMYDVGGTDSDNIPREGIGIASHWVTPDTAEWGLVRNTRFGAAAKPYFRTALHEIGHAMSLFHNTVNNGIMNTTDVIAASSTPTNPFPNNILWSHAADDQKRLRHRPDIEIRPGGSPFGSASDTPLSPDDETIEPAGLTLRVTPLLVTVPLGAPVRVDVELVNESSVSAIVPAKLSLKSDFVVGEVRGPVGDARGFAPIVYCVEDHEMVTLKPGESVRGALTLLRGADGALFGSHGVHQIGVSVSWELEGIPVEVRGYTSVMVTPAVTESHAEAAHKVLTTPDTHLVLALGGDHLKEGIDAVQTAIADETLRPHFAFTEARRVGTRFMKRPANPSAAAELLIDAVLSHREIEKAADILKSGKDAKTKQAAKALRDQAVDVGASPATVKKLEAIK